MLALKWKSEGILDWMNICIYYACRLSKVAVKCECHTSGLKTKKSHVSRILTCIVEVDIPAPKLLLCK